MSVNVLPAYSQTTSVLLHETFDHPVGTLPPGWAVLGDGQENWGIHDASSAGGSPPEMRMSWSPSFVGESRLITPALNAGEHTAIRLKLNIFLSYYDLSPILRIGFSTDGGNSWTDFWEHVCTDDYGPVIDEHYFNIPANTDFHLGFYFEDDSWDIYYWSLDDIIVELLLDYDLAGVSVTGPQWPLLGEPSDYEVTIQNLGAEIVQGSEYTVRFYREGGILIDEVPGVDIAPASYESFNLIWTPEAAGPTWLYAYVDFPGDELIDNNTTPNYNVDVQQGEILEVVIGTGTETSGSIPISPWWGYSFSQTIYLQSEINMDNKRISGIGYQYAEGTPVLNEITEIWIAHTDLTQLDDVVQLTDAVKVYDGPFQFVAEEDFSWVDIDPFFYNNTDNLLITIIEKKPGFNSSSDVFYVTPLEDGQPAMSRFARNDSSPYDPQDLPSGVSISSRANIKLWLSAIPDHPTINVSPDHLDFGEVEVSLTETIPVVVKNVGGGTLEITGANFTNDNFSLDDASFPVLLETGEEQVFNVQFHPSEIQPEEGQLIFIADEDVPGNKTVQLEGKGLRFGILREGFEGELFPPLGWLVIDNNNDGDTWFRNVNTVPTGQTAPRTGIAAAGLPPYAGNWGETAYDDWLITPRMMWQDGDLFEFWIKRLANQDGQIWRVQLSTTGTEIQDFSPIDEIVDPPLSYVKKSYDLSEHGLTDGTQFYIAIQFNGVWCWPGVIDDVTGSVLLLNDYDLMITSFTGDDIVYEGSTNDYEVSFGNFGLEQVFADDYTIKIIAEANDQEHVLVTAPGQDIESGQTMTISIPVSFDEIGEYQLYAKIDFPEDEEPDNNTSDPIALEVISNTIVLKHIGTHPPNQDTYYTVYYPINFDDHRGASLHEALYYTNELNTGGIITRLTYYTSFAEPIPNRKVKVWMVETDLNSLADTAIPADDMKLVFDGTLDFNQGIGKININLTEPFVYTSSANLAVLVYYYQGGDEYLNNHSRFAYEWSDSGPIRNVYDVDLFSAVDPNNLENVFRTENFPVTSLMFETGSGLGSITGRVLLDDGGGSVEGAKVIIENADYPDHYAEIYTNATGHYTAPFMLAGSDLTVTISKYAYDDVVIEGVNLEPNGTVNLGNAYLVPRPVIALSGSVITSDTQLPAAGAEVKLFGLDDYETTSDENGHFAFAEVWGSTTYQIRITLEGYQPYIADVEVPASDHVLDQITILELAPSPNIVTATEVDDNVLLTWYAAGDPYPYEFRYDDGTLNGVLITTGTPEVVVGSAWKHDAIIHTVHWYTHNLPNYPPSPEVFITIHGLTETGQPNIYETLHLGHNVPNNTGWNTYELPGGIEAPNGFFFGISGYSSYVVIPYDDGIGEPFEWQPLTQWSNGMGTYQPLENVTAPPLHANIFMRAGGFTYGELDADLFGKEEILVLDYTSSTTPFILKDVEPAFAGEPEAPALSWPGQKAFNHYNVYRKLMPEGEWLQLNENPVNDTLFVDTGWMNLPGGEYQYAVEAEYTNGVTSEPALSNIIENTGAAFIPGDANCDGVVDVLDVIAISNYFIGDIPDPFCFINADVNGDGIVNILDIIATVHIFAEDKRPPY